MSRLTVFMLAVSSILYSNYGNASSPAEEEQTSGRLNPSGRIVNDLATLQAIGAAMRQDDTADLSLEQEIEFLFKEQEYTPLLKKASRQVTLTSSAY